MVTHETQGRVQVTDQGKSIKGRYANNTNTSMASENYEIDTQVGGGNFDRPRKESTKQKTENSLVI